MKKLIPLTLSALLFLAFVLTSGCSTNTANTIHNIVQSNKFALRMAVKSGTAHYVTKSNIASVNAVRAARVLRVMGKLRNGITDTEVSVDNLYGLMLNFINEENLDPVEHIAVNELLIGVKNRVDNLVSTGSLPYDAVTTTDKFITIVEQTVKMYAK